MDSCIFPVKVFRPTADGLVLVRIHTVEELGNREDKKIKDLYLHPSVTRFNRRDLKNKKEGDV
jgi:hypothetical protein